MSINITGDPVFQKFLRAFAEAEQKEKGNGPALGYMPGLDLSGQGKGRPFGEERLPDMWKCEPEKKGNIPRYFQGPGKKMVDPEFLGSIKELQEPAGFGKNPLDDLWLTHIEDVEKMRREEEKEQEEARKRRAAEEEARKRRAAEEEAKRREEEARRREEEKMDVVEQEEPLFYPEKTKEHTIEGKKVTFVYDRYTVKENCTPYRLAKRLGLPSYKSITKLDVNAPYGATCHSEFKDGTHVYVQRYLDLTR
jgi:hypothetical protein